MTCEKKTGSNYWTPTVLCSTVRIIAITLINYLLLINKKEHRDLIKNKRRRNRERISSQQTIMEILNAKKIFGICRNTFGLETVGFYICQF